MPTKKARNRDREKERERETRAERRLKEEYAEHKDAELFNPVARETAGV